MPSFKRKRPKVGDVIEIKTPEGFVYVQYSNDEQGVIRVLPGLYPNRLSPSEIHELVRQKERFVTIWPVDLFMDKSVWDWEAEIVAHEKVPEHARFIRLWRNQIPIGTDKEKWVLVVEEENGEEYIRPATELTPEEFWKLPIPEIWNPWRLKERLIDQEWTWEKERGWAIDPFTGEAPKRPQREEGKEEQEMIDQNLPHVVHHYLYFPRKRQAEAVAKEIEGKVYKVLVEKFDEEYRVLVINWFMMDEEFWDKVMDLDEELEDLARRHGGFLDGNEIGMIPGKDPLFEDYKGEGKKG